MDSMETKKKLTTILIHVILIIVSITMLVPFIWMILTAFKSVTEATSVDPFTIFPKIWRKDAFISVINNMNFLLLYKNTLLLIFFRVVCAVLTATMAGYAFGRLNFKGRDLCFGLVLFQMMVPVQIFIIPQYLMVSKMGMLNTIFALVFPGIVTAFGTFLLRQGYMGLPKDLEEAARLDGCNIGQTFLYIITVEIILIDHFFNFFKFCFGLFLCPLLLGSHTVLLQKQSGKLRYLCADSYCK